MKTLTPAVKGQIAIMALLLILSLVSAGMIIGGFGIATSGLSDSAASGVLLYGVRNIMHAIALGYGILYLAKGYGKELANYYRAFILLIAVTTVVTMFAQGTLSAEGQDILLPQCLAGIKTVLLLVLAFVPNLGKRNNWICFGIIFALDLISPLLITSLFTAESSSLGFIRIASVLTWLVLDITIAFAIRAKYEDKDARGTV